MILSQLSDSLDCPYLRELAPGHLRWAVALHHDSGAQRGRLLWHGVLQQVLV